MYSVRTVAGVRVVSEPSSAMKNQISVHIGASNKGFSALCLAVILLVGTLFQVGTAKASSFEYDFFSLDTGYSGKLYLKEASNVNGTVNDVLSGYVITPNLGMNVFDSTTASTFGPLGWDASGLTFFHLSWFDGVGNHAVVGIDSIRNTGGGFFDATFGGHWAPPSGPASVPDGTGTLMMLAGCLGLLSLIPCRRGKY